VTADPLTAKPTCHVCGQRDSVLLRRNTTRNGTSQVFWYCFRCQRYATLPVRWLPHMVAEQIAAQIGKTFNDIPVLVDWRDESQPCVICGSFDTEYHHWMPQVLASKPAVATEWSTWSTQGAPLCRRHHLLWHDQVTPWMAGHDKK